MRNVLVLLFGVVFICTACDPSRKLARLHKKHPEVFNAEEKDTFFVTETQYDTLYEFSTRTDTLVRFDSITKTKEIILRQRDTIRMRQLARPCTTFVKQVVYKPQVKAKKATRAKKEGFIAQAKRKAKSWLLAGFVLILLGYVFGRRR